MKKTVCLLLAALLLVFASCAAKEAPEADAPDGLPAEVPAEVPVEGPSEDPAEAPSEVQTEGPSKIHVAADYLAVSPEQMMEISPYIFSGICTGVTVNKLGAAEVEFSVKQVYQGEIKEKSVLLHALGANSFAVDGSYLIFARKCASVFDGCEYYGVNTIFCDGSVGAYEGSIAGEKLSFAAACQKVQDCLKDHAYRGDYTVEGEYCRSENLAEIYDYSPDAFLGIITGIRFNMAEDRTTYTVKITETLKGEVSGTVNVTAPKNLEIGGQYCWMLQEVEEGRTDNLAVSSTRSVLAADSGDAAEVLALAKTR